MAKIPLADSRYRRLDFLVGVGKANAPKVSDPLRGSIFRTVKVICGQPRVDLVARWKSRGWDQMQSASLSSSWVKFSATVLFFLKGMAIGCACQSAVLGLSQKTWPMCIETAPSELRREEGDTGTQNNVPGVPM